jgi:hypothetical protein
VLRVRPGPKHIARTAENRCPVPVIFTPGHHPPIGTVELLIGWRNSGRQLDWRKANTNLRASIRDSSNDQSTTPRPLAAAPPVRGFKRTAMPAHVEKARSRGAMRGTTAASRHPGVS